MHGSHTSVGGSFDTKMIAIIAYLAHQVSVSGLPVGNSTILSGLSYIPRTTTAIEISRGLVDTLINEPVPEWAHFLETADFQRDYEMTFGALVATGFACIFPWFVTERLITVLANYLIPGYNAEFLINEYLP